MHAHRLELRASRRLGTTLNARLVVNTKDASEKAAFNRARIMGFTGVRKAD